MQRDPRSVFEQACVPNFIPGQDCDCPQNSQSRAHWSWKPTLCRLLVARDSRSKRESEPEDVATSATLQPMRQTSLAGSISRTGRLSVWLPFSSSSVFWATAQCQRPAPHWWRCSYILATSPECRFTASSAGSPAALALRSMS